ncbi:MAG: phosphoglucosamine mutase [Candidatus Nanopelagicales bacterium]
MARLFGTDGIRGLANRELTSVLATQVAAAAAFVLGRAGRLEGDSPAGRPVAVVGRDTRASGEFLEAAVVAGLASAGVDVLRLGVVPTPAVAYLTAYTHASLGVMLSASHNPMPDNGIKFFSGSGHKLPDDVEDQIESSLARDWLYPVGDQVGRIRDLPEATALYVEHLMASEPTELTGLRVVVDCANGAASTVAPEVLRRAGAEVIAIHAAPDGLNINEGCGSTYLADLQAAVVEHGADVGIAHDGDADRCLAVDANGAVIDGDQIMAVLAVGLHERNELPEATLVTTVMSNLGLRLAMESRGITVIDTAVGDRYVLEQLRARQLTLGGEQSGHVINLNHATTGDGVLTAMQLLAQMSRSGRSLADLAAIMTRLPQVLINVGGVNKDLLAQAQQVHLVVGEVEAQLGATGRVLLRPSGTEPLIRVMVEASTLEQAEVGAERIAQAVREVLSLDQY